MPKAIVQIELNLDPIEDAELVNETLGRLGMCIGVIVAGCCAPKDIEYSMDYNPYGQDYLVVPKADEDL